MAVQYIVDGYNVIYYILKETSNTLRLRHDDFETSRNILIEHMASFCSTSPVAIVLVFDGQGKKATTTQPFGSAVSLEVVYAPTAHSADVIIQRAVYRSANPGQIIVVSDDRGIRDLCGSKGAMVMRPKNFLETLRRLAEDNQPLRRTVSVESIERVSERLEGKGLEHLERLRDSLLKKPEPKTQTKKGL